MTSTDGGPSLSGVTPAVAATAIGSFPTGRVREVVTIIRGELPDLPLLPELPNRGPGADMIGRTSSMLSALSSEFACRTTPTGWRITGSLSGSLPQAMRAGASWLGEDMDAIEEAFEGYEGLFKIQLVGPWTMAAVVELANGEPVLSDAGATGAFAAAIAEVAAAQAAELRRRVPGAKVVVQLDEPMLEQVLVGSVLTQSGFNAIAPAEPGVLVSVLADVAAGVREGAAFVGVHSCSGRTPIDLVSRSGVDFISIDLRLIAGLSEHERAEAESSLATMVESGRVVLAGLDLDRVQAADIVRPVADLLNRTGLTEDRTQHHLVVTPTCGLAGEATLDSVVGKLARLNEAARALRGNSASADN